MNNIQSFDPKRQIFDSQHQRLKIVKGRLYLEDKTIRAAQNCFVRFFTRSQYSQKGILKHFQKIHLSSLSLHEADHLNQNYSQLLDKAAAHNATYKTASSARLFFIGKSRIDLTTFTDSKQALEIKFEELTREALNKKMQDLQDQISPIDVSILEREFSNANATPGKVLAINTALENYLNTLDRLEIPDSNDFDHIREAIEQLREKLLALKEKCSASVFDIEINAVRKSIENLDKCIPSSQEMKEGKDIDTVSFFAIFSALKNNVEALNSRKEKLPKILHDTIEDLVKKFEEIEKKLPEINEELAKYLIDHWGLTGSDDEEINDPFMESSYAGTLLSAFKEPSDLAALLDLQLKPNDLKAPRVFKALFDAMGLITIKDCQAKKIASSKALEKYIELHKAQLQLQVRNRCPDLIV